MASRHHLPRHEKRLTGSTSRHAAKTRKPSTLASFRSSYVPSPPPPPHSLASMPCADLRTCPKPSLDPQRASRRSTRRNRQSSRACKSRSSARLFQPRYSLPLCVGRIGAGNIPSIPSMSMACDIHIIEGNIVHLAEVWRVCSFGCRHPLLSFFHSAVRCMLPAAALSHLSPAFITHSLAAAGMRSLPLPSSLASGLFGPPFKPGYEIDVASYPNPLSSLGLATVSTVPNHLYSFVSIV